jgi:hypothetical protein
MPLVSASSVTSIPIGRWVESRAVAASRVMTGRGWKRTTPTSHGFLLGGRPVLPIRSAHQGRRLIIAAGPETSPQAHRATPHGLLKLGPAWHSTEIWVGEASCPCLGHCRFRRPEDCQTALRVGSLMARASLNTTRDFTGNTSKVLVETTAPTVGCSHDSERLALLPAS